MRPFLRVTQPYIHLYGTWYFFLILLSPGLGEGAQTLKGYRGAHSRFVSQQLKSWNGLNPSSPPKGEVQVRLHEEQHPFCQQTHCPQKSHLPFEHVQTPQKTAFPARPNSPPPSTAGKSNVVEKREGRKKKREAALVGSTGVQGSNFSRPVAVGRRCLRLRETLHPFFSAVQLEHQQMGEGRHGGRQQPLKLDPIEFSTGHQNIYGFQRVQIPKSTEGSANSWH